MSKGQNKIEKSIDKIKGLAERLEGAELTEDEAGRIEGGFVAPEDAESDDLITINFYQCK